MKNNSEQLNSPVLLIAFLRPEATIKILKQLRSNGVIKFYIAIDGPRTIEETTLVNSSVSQIKMYCESVGIDAIFKVSKINLGIALSVVTALDWVFETTETIIVFEDDLIFSFDFVNYCNFYLETLKTNSQVDIISGNNFFPENFSEKSPDWTNYPLIWGWATWKNKWIEMRNIYVDKPRTKHIYFRNSSLAFFYTGYKRSLSGKIDSWALPLAFNQYRQKKLTLIPPKNLVSNIGNDNKAIHTIETAWHMHHDISNYPGDFLEPKNLIFSQIESTNKKIEKYVFKISRLHVFSPIMSLFFDRFRFAKSNEPLWERLEDVEVYGGKD